MAIFTHSPKSGHIKSVSYDDMSSRLAITFEHERQPEPKTYVHGGVPIAAFNSYLRWMKAGHSAGEFYQRFLKRYPLVSASDKKENQLQ